jgi:hypothetical protein
MSVLAGSVVSAHAATFAQFGQPFTSSKLFEQVGSSPSTAKFETIGAIPGSTPQAGIQFYFSPIDPTDPYALKPADLGLQSQNIVATIVLSSSSSSIGTRSGNTASESYDDITVKLVANGTQVVNGVTVHNGANLLTMTSGFITGASHIGGTLSGSITGPSNPKKGSATLSGNDVTSVSTIFDNTVTFSSDFIDFSGAADKGYSLGFTNATPYFGLAGTGLNTYIADFAAQGTGTFAATFVPEPGAFAMLAGLATGGMLLRRRRK